MSRPSASSECLLVAHFLDHAQAADYEIEVRTSQLPDGKTVVPVRLSDLQQAQRLELPHD